MFLRLDAISTFRGVHTLIFTYVPHTDICLHGEQANFYREKRSIAFVTGYLFTFLVVLCLSCLVTMQILIFENHVKTWNSVNEERLSSPFLKTATLFWQKISRNGQGIFHKSADDRERWGLLIFAAKATFDAWLCPLAHSPQEAAVPRKVLVKMNLTVDCSMIKATIRTVNFAACGNYRPHFTKIIKIWQDRSPIRKSSIILRSRKTLFILLHQLLFNPASQNVLGWRWDEEDSHTAYSHNFLFPRSPSSLALRLFIVLNLNSSHEIFFRGARIRRRITFDTHENSKKEKYQYNDNPHSC